MLKIKGLSKIKSRSLCYYVAVSATLLMGMSSNQLLAASINLPQTGQDKCYATDGVTTGEIPCVNTGQDGELRKGVEWPVPRFTDIGDGTVKDNLTGLIWLKDASCSELGSVGNGTDTFMQALLAVSAFSDNQMGVGDCGLSDNSVAGDWRLPNIRELQSLISQAYEDQAVPDTEGTGKWSEGDPFSGIMFTYWSSTTNQVTPTDAYSARLDFGAISDSHKDWSSRYIWPVKGVSTTLAKTGQSTCFDPSGITGNTIACAGTGQDGDLQMGVALPEPRFVNNGDGTVTDMLTGLVWLHESNCFLVQNWAQVLDTAKGLSDTGTESAVDDCGLSDGSTLGSWRLPNTLEFSSLIHFGFAGPGYADRALSNSAGAAQYNESQDDPFTYVQNYNWTSTTSSTTTGTGAIRMVTRTGLEVADRKSATSSVWLVRDSLDDSDFLLSLIPAIISSGNANK